VRVCSALQCVLQVFYSVVQMCMYTYTYIFIFALYVYMYIHIFPPFLFTFPLLLRWRLETHLAGLRGVSKIWPHFDNFSFFLFFFFSFFLFFFPTSGARLETPLAILGALALIRLREGWQGVLGVGKVGGVGGGFKYLSSVLE